MHWLPDHLLLLCLMGALLLYTSSGRAVHGNCARSQEDEYDTDYDVTAMPDYDYNATFDYIFYSNTSGGTLDLEEILKRGRDDEMISDAACCFSPSLLLFHSLLLIQLSRLLCA